MKNSVGMIDCELCKKEVDEKGDIHYWWGYWLCGSCLTTWDESELTDKLEECAQ